MLVLATKNKIKITQELLEVSDVNYESTLGSPLLIAIKNNYSYK